MNKALNFDKATGKNSGEDLVKSLMKVKEKNRQATPVRQQNREKGQRGISAGNLPEPSTSRLERARPKTQVGFSLPKIKARKAYGGNLPDAILSWCDGKENFQRSESGEK